MALSMTYEQRPGKKLPTRAWVHHSYPDRMKLNLTEENVPEYGKITEYRNKYNLYTTYRQRSPIVRPAEVKLEYGEVVKNPLVYSQDMLPLHSHHPHLEGRKDHPKFFNIPTQRISTYKQHFPPHLGWHKPNACLPRFNYLKNKKMGLDSETTTKEHYRASWQARRSPIPNLHPFVPSDLPMESLTSSADQFRWKYQPPRSTHRPRRAALAAGKFEDKTTTLLDYVDYPAEAYLAPFKADMWEAPPQEPSAWFDVSPSAADLSKKEPQTPGSNKVVPELSSDETQSMIVPDLNTNLPKCDTSRRANYSTSYGDDFNRDLNQPSTVR